MRLAPAHESAVDHIKVGDAVGVSPPRERFERPDLVGPGGDDQLAATLARHAVLLAEGVQPLASLDAEDGLPGIPRVIDAGEDDAAVVGGYFGEVVKSFLACAFVERACRRGFTARYLRMPRLLHELAVGRGDGSYTQLLTRLAKLDLLAIDDWMLAPLRDTERRDLTEVIEDRAERASTLIASQLPVTDWHAVIGDPNQADAICDRLLHDAHRIDMKGRSMRRTHDAPAGGRKETT